MKKRSIILLICSVVLLCSLLLAAMWSALLQKDPIPNQKDPPPASDQPNAKIEANTYEDILSIYRLAVEHLGGYYKLYPQEFAADMYATEIANASDDVKSVYQSIFMPCFYLYMHQHGENYQGHGINAFGHTLFDVNGNGTEELVLMTDECDIVAIFAAANGKAKLVFSNSEGARYYITANGSIQEHYQGKKGSNEWDTTYYEYTYMWKNDDTLVNAGECEAPINKYMYREELCAITKGKLTSPFVRLMGPLTVQKSEIVSWEWFDTYYREDYNVCLTIWGALTEEEAQISIHLMSIGRISEKGAQREGDTVYFEDEYADGRIEFCAQGVWLIIDESHNKNFPTGIWLLKHVENVWG